MFSTTAKRVVAATFVGGIVALSPVVAPAANAAPVGCADYIGALTTTTTLTIAPSSGLAVGDTFTATANVTIAGGAPAFPGTVTFTYNNVSKDAPVLPSGDTETVSFQAVQGTNPVTATYQGVCPGGAAEVLGSSTTSVPVVAGVEANGGGNGGNGNGGNGSVGGISGGTTGGGTVGGLAATGMDSQTELYALLGAGMVAVGGLTLVVRRRRVEA
jgi:LPXTG-motif cell wall-anchored protein